MKYTIETSQDGTKMTLYPIGALETEFFKELFAGEDVKVIKATNSSNEIILSKIKPPGGNSGGLIT